MKVFIKRLHFYCILHLKQVNPISQIWIEVKRERRQIVFAMIIDTSKTQKSLDGIK